MVTRVQTIYATGAPPAAAPVLRLHLKGCALKPLDVLVTELKDRMLAAKEIPGAIKAKISTWYARYSSRFTLGIDSAPAAECLCFLLFDAIRPIQIVEEDKAVLDAAASLDEEIRSIIAPLLPEGSDVDAYIEELEVLNDEFMLSEELASSVKPSAEELLEQEAEALRAKQAHLFEMQKEALLGRADRITATEEATAARVAVATEAAHAVAEEMLTLKRADEALNAKLAAEKKAAMKLSATAERIFKGVL